MITFIACAAFVIGGMLTAGVSAFCGEFDYGSDTLMVQIFGVFLLWPLLLPVIVGKALRKARGA